MEVKKCANCGRNLPNRRSLISFTNIQQDSPFYFCSRKCKNIWLVERLKKTQFDEVGNLVKKKERVLEPKETSKDKKALCKYCKNEWPSNASKIQHERWCDKNPDKRKYRNSPGNKKSKIKLKSKQRNERIKELKTIKPYFSDVWNGVKTFEVRFNDRGFCIGDFLLLREYSIEANEYLSREIICKVDYILDNSDYLKKGYIVMGIQIIIKNDVRGILT